MLPRIGRVGEAPACLYFFLNLAKSDPAVESVILKRILLHIQYCLKHKIHTQNKCFISTLQKQLQDFLITNITLLMQRVWFQAMGYYAEDGAHFKLILEWNSVD